MARFTLTDGDVTILTQAFNALRAGMGTHLAPSANLEGFLDAWKSSTSAFASDAGFIGIHLDGQPKGSATVVLCQFQKGAVDAELGEHLRKLSRELLKGFELTVLRAGVDSIQGDRLLLLSGFLRDGVMRKLIPDVDGVLRDLSIYSLTVDDLVPIEAEPANFVYDVDGSDGEAHQEPLPLGA